MARYRDHGDRFCNVYHSKKSSIEEHLKSGFLNRPHIRLLPAVDFDWHQAATDLLKLFHLPGYFSSQAALIRKTSSIFK